MSYLYRCKCGRLTERSFVSWADRTGTTSCVACGRQARYSFGDTVAAARTVQVTPDIPAHFNSTTGCVIRSRRHLRDLQKRFGFQDYEKGIRHRPTSYERVGRMPPGILWGAERGLDR